MILRIKLALLFFLFLSVAAFGQDSNTVASLDTVVSAQSNLSQESEVSQVFPVVLKRDTLFFISQSYNGISAQERAKKVSENLEHISNKFNEYLDSIYYQIGDDFGVIMVNSDLAFIVSKEDAAAEGMTLKSLINERMQQLADGFDHTKYNLSSKEWMKRIGFTTAALAGLILIMWLILRFFRILNARLSKIDRKLLSRRNNLIKYFIPRKTKNIFVFLSSVLRFGVIVLFLLMYLPFMFSFLPWTKGIVSVFYSYIADPVRFVVYGFIDFLPHLFFIVVIMIIARYFVRVLRDMAEDIESGKLVIKNFPKDWAVPTEKLFAIVIYAFSLVLVFPHLPGSDSAAFKGVSIFLGVLFSLGSTSAVSNIVAGIVITYMRPFQIGDRVRILDTEGEVVDKTMLVTRIRTLKNEDVTIPNATIINNHLINYSTNAKDPGLILHTLVSLGYDVPHELAEKLLLRAARKTTLIQRDPKPFVYQKSLDDNFVTYELNAYTKQPAKKGMIYSELHKNILEVFDAEGVEILSPKYVASRDGNMSTVPSQKGVDLRNPLEKAIDHLTGKNQKPVVVKEEEKEVEQQAAVSKEKPKKAATTKAGKTTKTDKKASDK